MSSQGGESSLSGAYSTDPKAARRQLLSNHFLLQGTEQRIVDEILRLSTVRKVARGQTVFERGDEADGLFGVLSGKLKIYVISESGREFILNLAVPGDLCGEIALLDGTTRSASFAALEDSELLHVRRAPFLAFMEREPALMGHMIRVLCQRLRYSSDMVEDSAFLELAPKLAKRLLALAETHGEPFQGGIRLNFKVSQQLLGDMTGATREAVNKALKSLREADLLDQQDGHYILKDLDALEDIVI